MLAYTQGRVEESIAFCRRAVEQDPLNPMAYSFLGRSCISAGRFEEGERALRKGLEISPDAIAFHFMIAMLYGEQGRYEEGLAEAAREPADWARLCAQSILQFRAGDRAASDAALEQLIARGETSGYQIAMAYAARGDNDQAFAWLDRAFSGRDSGLAVLKLSRRFEPLHDDPRWPAFLKKLGLEP